MSRFRLYLLLLGLLLVLYGVAEYYRPQPTDWTHTYTNRDRIPFGSYALVELLPDLFGHEVTVVRETPFLQIKEKAGLFTVDTTIMMTSVDSTVMAREADTAGTPPVHYAQTTTPTNYLFVNDRFPADSLDIQALLHFAESGSQVFIAARFLPEPLLRELQLRTRYAASGTRFFTADTTTLRFTGTRAGFRFARIEQLFSLYQTGRQPDPTLHALATDDRGRAVLVRARRGRGFIYLCTVPAAFTNYYVLRPTTAGFAFAALSQLPKGPVWWDEYQKQGREENQSLLRVVLRHDALRWAFYLLLLGGALLLWLGARRRQRAIPVIQPLPNNTLQFVSTVASLYQQGDNHAPIAHRKIDLFLDFLRTRYHEPTDDLADEQFRHRLSQKSGLPRPQVNDLFQRLTTLQTTDHVGDQELLELSTLLSNFRRQ